MNHFKHLFERYPDLSIIEDNILDAFKLLKKTYESDNTLFLCGNGGSAADAEHIVGELMKNFTLEREIDEKTKKSIFDEYGYNGSVLANRLQKGLRAISLTSHISLSTAFSNDVDSELVFAQQLFVLGRKQDVLLAISTSGNSLNVIRAMEIAKIQGLKTIALTGRAGGKCAELADCLINVPANETYKVQEYHLPIYHTLCLMLEANFFEK